MDWAAWVECACTLGASCVLMRVPALLRWEEAKLHVHRLFFVIARATQRSKRVHGGKKKRGLPLALMSFYKQLWWAQHKQTDDSYLRYNREVGWRCMNNWVVEKMFQCYGFCQWPFSHSRSTAGMHDLSTTSPLTLCLYSTQHIPRNPASVWEGKTRNLKHNLTDHCILSFFFFYLPDICIFFSSWKPG